MAGRCCADAGAAGESDAVNRIATRGTRLFFMGPLLGGTGESIYAVETKIAGMSIRPWLVRRQQRSAVETTRSSPPRDPRRSHEIPHVHSPFREAPRVGT